MATIPLPYWPFPLLDKKIFCPNGTVIWIYENGIVEYTFNGELHRLGGPAKLWPGSPSLPAYEEWYLFGKMHRENGPAYICADGRRFWYLNGERHREDGPAIDHLNGSWSWSLHGPYKGWFLLDKECTEEQHSILTQGSVKDLLLMMHQGFDRFIERRFKNEIL